MKKVIIVGAGPAGLFAANELVVNGLRDVIVYDKKKKIGGAGLNVDGKLNFHPQVGCNLYEFVGPDVARDVIASIKLTFSKYGVEIGSPSSEYVHKAVQYGIKYIPISQAHVGSDELPSMMNDFKMELVRDGVEFRLKTEVKGVDIEQKRVFTDKGTDTYDYLLIATGRYGYCPPELITKFNPIDVGVRVEVPNEVFKEIRRDVIDPKFHLRTSTYDDFVRTFCTCYDGFVVKDKYSSNAVGVNGHSYSLRGKKSPNTNFALLVRVNLTKPFEDTTQYGLSIVKQANLLGSYKPLIQRLGDLRKGRRSTWDRIRKSYVVPTLKDVTPGDISMAMPKRMATDVIEGIDKLDEVLPGIASDQTLLYAPEVKFYAKRVVTNESLQSSVPEVFVAGDGAGVSRGIVGAAATGIIAARGILKEIR
ncbi:MAG: NAD(P)/FAD-dependent oxidoreductase [Candidatus Geothermarchaeales archaeon]